MTNDAESYQRLKEAWEALDAEFGGKARECPRCRTSFTSRFDRGQCPKCRYVFLASDPESGNATLAVADEDASFQGGKDAALSRSGGIDWEQLEERLFALTAADVKESARTSAHESFYGFAFDCNSDYGQVLLCLNTEEDLQQQAEAYKRNHPDLYGDEAIDDIRARLRWNAGDWKFQGFNSRIFDTGWARFESRVLDACLDEEEDEETFMTPTQHQFMKSVCRVLVRLEIEGAFDCLPKTEGFKAYAADHDELDSDSWDRLAGVRAQSIR